MNELAELQRALGTVWENHKDDFIKETPVVSKDGKLSFDIEVDTEVLLDSLYTQIVSDGIVDLPDHIKTADDFRALLIEDSSKFKVGGDNAL